MHRYLVFALLPALFASAWAGETPKHLPITASCLAFYPQAAFEKDLKGSATVSFQVAPDGRAKDVVLNETSGITALDKAATDCIAASRYDVPTGSEEKVFIENVDFYTTSGQGIGRPHHCNGYRPKDVTAAGVTELAFTITEEGATADNRVAKSSGNADLDEAAVRCTTHWRYKGAIKDNIPIAVPWKAAILWGDVPPPAVTGEPTCWRAVWPRLGDLDGITGPTRLSFITHRVGGMRDLHIVKSSGREDLDHIAMTCISRQPMAWPVETVVEIPADFHREVSIDWHRMMP